MTELKDHFLGTHRGDCPFGHKFYADEPPVYCRFLDDGKGGICMEVGVKIDPLDYPTGKTMDPKFQIKKFGAEHILVGPSTEFDAAYITAHAKTLERLRFPCLIADGRAAHRYDDTQTHCALGHCNADITVETGINSAQCDECVLWYCQQCWFDAGILTREDAVSTCADHKTGSFDQPDVIIG